MPPRISRAWYGFTFELDRWWETPLKPVELSERLSSRPSCSACANACSAVIVGCFGGRDGWPECAFTPSTPSARAYASDASSAVG